MWTTRAGSRRPRSTPRTSRRTSVTPAQERLPKPSSEKGCRKVAVIGTTAAGKTTFSVRLAERLGVVHVELDALYHGPNWTPTAEVEFRRAVQSALGPEGWVADGNYSGSLGDLVLDQADVVVWLDIPFWTTMGRLWRRTLRRIRNRTELWSGNRETWRGAFFSRDSLFVWVVRTHFSRRRRYEEKLRLFNAVRLRSSEEAEAWLQRYV
jgi:adenylate kinase family enzyme